MDARHAALVALAARSENVVTRPSLLAAGWTDRMIQWALRCGWLQPLHPGVYLVGAAPPTWQQRLRAGVAAAGEDAMASLRAAFVLWGLDGLSSAPLDVTVRRDDGPTPAGVILHRSRRIEPVSVIAGIPVSGVERTLLEVGAVCRPVVVEKGFSSAWRRGLTTPAKSLIYLDEHGGKGRRGTRTFRDVVALYSDGGRPPGSGGEVVFLRVLREHGIEPPDRQLTIPLLDGSAATLDFAWPQRRKAIEFVGLGVHADSRAHDQDTWRENDIRDAGWALRRYAPRSLDTRPEAVAHRVLRFLGGSTDSGCA